MFALLTRRRKPRSRRQTYTRLSLESLESRYCLSGSNITTLMPSPPRITSFMAMPLSGHRVELMGAVADSNPQAVNVSFSGAASGSVQATASDGTSASFEFITTDASLGQVSAVAINGQNLSSESATASISVMAPTITLSLMYGSQRQVTVSGQVSGLDAAGAAVGFSGVVSGSVVADASGNFSFTATASALGNIQAQTTDSWGNESNTAVVTAASNKPVITAFSPGTTFSPDKYVIQGTVTDESVQGLVITFGGPDELTAVQATVASDGSFAVTVQFSTGFSGTISARTTDWWGLTSDVVYTFIG